MRKRLNPIYIGQRRTMKKKEYPKLTAILSYAGPLLIFLGIFRLMIYYDSYGISIISFLQLSEILTSFLDIIVLVSTVSTFAFAVLLLADSTVIEVDQDQPEPERFFIKRLQYHFYSNWKYLAFLFAILIASIVIEYLDPRKPRLYLGILATIIASISVNVLWRELKVLQHERKSNLLTNGTIGIFIFTISIICATALFGYIEVLTSKYIYGYDKVQIQFTDNSTIFCNENYYYIGKTNNYLFLYSEIKDEAEVIPMNLVKNLKFPNHSLLRNTH